MLKNYRNWGHWPGSTSSPCESVSKHLGGLELLQHRRQACLANNRKGMHTLWGRTYLCGGPAPTFPHASWSELHPSTNVPVAPAGPVNSTLSAINAAVAAGIVFMRIT